MGSSNYKLKPFIEALDKCQITFENAINEVECYFALLTLVVLIDSKNYEFGIKFGVSLIDKCQKANSRSLDCLLAKIFYFVARCYELVGRFEEFRNLLLLSQRTATLKQDSECLAVIINTLLRNYLAFNLYEQADKLVSKSAFPESANNSQFARYLYYLGRIKAIQLDYSASYDHLLQAIRKAPQSASSVGFQQAVYKSAVIVQLLIGEIPERSIFNQKSLKKSLLPYFHLTQAVRIGDLESFEKDKTFSLILRLRQNVIKTGVKMISVSYSRISLEDVRKKLGLESREDAEYIVAKAIRDRVIDATIDHENGFVKSKELIDVYSTNEPQDAFNQRINFCLGLHNESVKALRFPSQENESVKLLEELRQKREEMEKEIEQEMRNDENGMDF